MKAPVEECAVVLDVPEGTDVDGASIFGADGLEFALYVEPAEPSYEGEETRRALIEGRSYVNAFTSFQTGADGWLVLFTTDDGVGFELARTMGDRRVIFWGDRLPDDSIRERAIDIGRGAQPS